MIKKVLIIINITKDDSMNLAREISIWLKEKSIDCEFISFDGFCDDSPVIGYDLVITLGGDGTVLWAARNCLEADIPVFPVNLGQFGFIATVEPKNWKKALTAVLKDKAVYSYRGMTLTKVIRNDKVVYTSYALNDTVISAEKTATTINLNITYNGSPLCDLKSDGVIFSTSTGSTAYSAAAGGPIVSPELNAVVMTPINSFSLSSRPIVLNPDGEIAIKVEKSRTKEINLIVDGQEPFSLLTEDVVTVCKAKKEAKLLFSTSENFYNALRSKLNWWGGPHA